MALLHVLMDAGCVCRAAHCNFHLRGEESMRDEQFVRDLCHRLSVPLSVSDFDVAGYQRSHGGSVEMACREMRYKWFEEERARQGCELIAVAHHADDQAETFFLNLTRGTGIRGLTGMKRHHGRIWRPLLETNRQDILDYLDVIGQNYVTDSTNATNDYRRNRLRNMVLPVFEQQFPHAMRGVRETMDHLSDDYQLLMSLTSIVLPDEHHIQLACLMTHPHSSTLLYHRIRHLGFNRTQCEQMIAAAQRGHSGKLFESDHHRLVVNRKTIDIEPIENNDADLVFPIDLSGDVISPVHIIVSHNNAPFSPRMCDGKHKVAFNQKILQCHQILLRHWRKGDRIRPFGLKGTKLVSDVFSDLKLDHRAKHDAWLLEGDGEILWVLGYRSSAHFQVDRQSTDYIILTID